MKTPEWKCRKTETLIYHYIPSRALTNLCNGKTIGRGTTASGCVSCTKCLKLLKLFLTTKGR